MQLLNRPFLLKMARNGIINVFEWCFLAEDFWAIPYNKYQEFVPT